MHPPTALASICWSTEVSAAGEIKMLKTKLVVGNWKMNGLREDLIEIDQLFDEIGEPAYDVLTCPPLALVHECMTKQLARSY